MATHITYFAHSSDAVTFWLESLRCRAGRDLWAVMDDDLRLAVTQEYVLNSTGAPDDSMAAELSARDPRHPHFQRMIDGLVSRWQQTHRALAAPIAYPYRCVPVGYCLEVLVAYGQSPSGVAEPSLFITRFGDDFGWCVAATDERLPVPGWPPTDWVIPQLRSKP